MRGLAWGTRYVIGPNKHTATRKRRRKNANLPLNVDLNFVEKAVVVPVLRIPAILTVEKVCACAEVNGEQAIDFP